MKIFSAVIAAALLLMSAPAMAQVEPGVNFSRVFLVQGGEVIANLSNPTGGLSYKVGLNTKRDDLGNVVAKATQGLGFTTEFLADEDILISTIGIKYWFKLSESDDAEFGFGVVGDFIEPGAGEGESRVPELTNLVGLSADISFTANGIPAMFGGSYSWISYVGVEGLNKGEIFLGIRM